VPTRRVPLAAVAAIVAAIAALVPLTSAAPADAEPIRYVPPVDAPVSRPFDPPATPFGPGNRGLDYATTPGQPVVASADGTVVFAGQVGGTLHVTLRHADGLRTSYSFLDSIAVPVGDHVRRGDPIGTASAAFHFGVRTPDGTYLDPARLFAGELRPAPHLIPGADDGERPLADERPPLLDVVGDRLATGAAFGDEVARRLVGGLGDDLRSLADLTSASHVASIARDLELWFRSQGRCTAADAPVPPPTGRHILVEVGGIGSTSDAAAITRVDAAGLGYAPGDVVEFSYAGGRTPPQAGDRSPLAAIPSSSYSATDTGADLRRSATRLADLLAAVAAAQPGVPIDVVAHSQGGVVSRLALEQVPPVPAEVRTLVTLGTPHHGANLATALTAAEADPAVDLGLSLADGAGVVPVDPHAPAVGQLAETSPLIDQLNRQLLPPGVHLTSIGASGDLVVPAPRTLVDAVGDSTTVELGGLHAHDDLPGSKEATREIGLAVAGRAPTCRSLGEATRAAITSETIDAFEDAGTAAATLGTPN
jgi:hypothetical protein